ncbi:type II secretion system F family protein [Candidatus Nomurabacteria bacterium]|nr:type II secretion system F family protein [Candidatus Nomurabacteria bacterium]
MQLKNNKKNKNSFGIYLGMGQEKEYVMENLSFLVSSGMPIAESLKAIETELKTNFMKKMIGQARESVENGVPLHKALEETGLFGVHEISLIKNGEESGILVGNLRVIAEQAAKNRIFKSRLRSALMYPALILSVTFVIGLGVAWFILPKLATMFTQLHVKLPLITKIFISLGSFLSKYGAIFVPILIVSMIVIVYFVFYFPKTRIIGQYFLYSIPGIKKLIQELEISRLGYLLGTLNKAGLPLLQAIGSLKESTLSPFYGRFYDFLYQNIEDGNSFEQSFSKYKDIRDVLPASIQQIIVIGEQSGNLSTALVKIGNVYEEKTELTSKNISVALEPILLVIVWAGVMLVAVAVILPIYSLIGGIDK